MSTTTTTVTFLPVVTFNEGPWTAAVVVLAIVATLLLLASFAVLRHVEAFSIRADNGETVKASPRRDRDSAVEEDQVADEETEGGEAEDEEVE